MKERVRLVTPVFRASFPQVFKAEAFDGGAAKYSLTAIWTPDNFTANDKARWAEIQNALDVESKKRFRMAYAKLPANYKKGIRDGAEKAHLAGYGEGKLFATLSTKIRPGVVNLQREPISVEEGNEDEIYPGCYCRATVNVYGYDNRSKGLALGLMNLQKIKDGERFDSKVEASADFEDDVDSEWLNDLL